MPSARSHFVCLPCRASFKKPTDFARVRHDVCPRCAHPLLDAGTALAVPKRRDTAAWRALAVLLIAGVRFRQDCCGCGPGFRPRTPREVRERLLHAADSAIPVGVALVCPDPTHVDVRRQAGRGAYAPHRAETRRAPARER
ncbi:deoxyxylulose-5-phosphate synthase [Streptomyces flavofungini]|nr:deoxyxylulose-5-phosphate synthase [Streptomyces flavofungini]WJV44503.1 deoxyxylulose-5-phosphate synthase [Streptomyces flavofungini]